MKIIASSYPGMEDVCCKEILELAGNKAVKVANGKVEFDCESISKIEGMRSADYLYYLLGKFNFKNLDDLGKKAGKIDYQFIKKDFVVRCRRQGEHDFNSIDVEKTVGEAIYKKEHVVNMKSNEIVIADIIGNECFIGRLIKNDMHKRDYRVKLNKQGINACMAYALLRISGWTKNESLLNANCMDGVVAIEAGLIGGNKIYGVDNNKSNIISSDINSRLAKKEIWFYQKEMDEVKDVIPRIDYLVAYMPSESKRVSKNFMNRFFDAFFDFAANNVNKRTVIFTLDDEAIKDRVNVFKIIDKREITAGRKYIAYVLE